MANVLTEVTPKLLAQGLMALRQNVIMPQLVNRRYEALAGEKGSTIDVPVPSAISVAAVSPGATPPSTADVQPTSVPIALDQWYEAPFYMTDQDTLIAMEGTLPLQASEAIKALANKVDQNILAKYVKFYGYQGNETSGAHRTPFTDASGVPTDTRDATRLRTILNKQLAPLGDRHAVMDPDAEGAALNIRAFQDMSWVGDVSAIRAGTLNERLGFRWWMDQNIPVHTAGTAAAVTTLAVDFVAGYAAGLSSVVIDQASSTSTVVVGDILSFAGHSQTYVVEAAATIDTTGVAVSIYPPLVAAIVDNEAVDVKPSHSVNMAFHRDAIAFATRPLAQHGASLGVISQVAIDPVSGLALRLEITHEHKRVRFSYDMLWGSAVVRRQFGARLAGAP